MIPSGSSRHRWQGRFALTLVVSAAIAAGCDDGTTTDGDAATTDAIPAGATDVPTAQAIEAALAAADDYFNTQEVEKAEMILARLIERAPAEGRAHELMGQVLSLRAAEAGAAGDEETAARLHREAYDHYERASAIGPASAGLEQSAGTIAMVAGEPDRALAHFEAASALDPVNPQHPLYAAQLLIANGDYASARQRLERVLELDPDEPLAHASLAIIALERGNTDAALRGIAQARALAPHDLRFRVQEARILRRSGNARQAVETLIALGETQWRHEGLAIELAEGYRALERHHDAARVWMYRFTSADPSPRTYLDATRAGEALRRAGEIDDARYWLRQAQVLAPNAPEVSALATALDGE